MTIYYLELINISQKVYLINLEWLSTTKKKKKKTKDKLYSNSAIGKHLIKNQNCFVNYNMNTEKYYQNQEMIST